MGGTYVGTSLSGLLAKRGAYKLPDPYEVNVPVYWGYEGDIHVTRIERRFNAPKRDLPLSGYFICAALARSPGSDHSYQHSYLDPVG